MPHNNWFFDILSNKPASSSTVQEQYNQPILQLVLPFYWSLSVILMLAVWLLGRVSIYYLRYSAVTIWASRNQFPLLQVQIRLFKTEIFLANVWQNQGSDNTSICVHSWPAFTRILKICDCLSVSKSFQTVKRSCTSNISCCHFLEVLRVAFTRRNEYQVFPARVLIIHLKKKYNWRCELWFRTWNMQSATRPW